MFRKLWEKIVLKNLSIIYRFWPASTMLPEYKVALNLALKYNCKSILDVGCGAGNLGKILLERNIVDKYLGLDINNIFKLRDPRAKFIRCNARNPPPLDDYYDCVFFINSLFYIGVDYITLYEGYGKYFIIIDINPSFKYIANKLMDLIEGKIRLTPDKLKEILKSKGFRIIEEKIGGQYYFVLESSRRNNL